MVLHALGGAADQYRVAEPAAAAGHDDQAGAHGLGVGRLAAMVVGFLVTFGVRGLAIKFGWSLPVFRESTKRERWKSESKEFD